MVLFPAPVSPTRAMVCPDFTWRLKSFRTRSPSLYAKLTWSNLISPAIGSQFSGFGSKLSPYFSSTSGLSSISHGVSINDITRSALACAL